MMAKLNRMGMLDLLELLSERAIKMLTTPPWRMKDHRKARRAFFRAGAELAKRL
jgi:hypothetical protein